ncbi:MAG: glycosyltransferase 87 family protein [Myxococcaceae bacterium]
MKRGVFAALVVACLLARLWMATRPIDQVDGLTIPDDTYLSLTVAQNLAAGRGPLYGEGFTNGFQPLWVYLLVPAFWASSDPMVPLRAGLMLGALFDTASLVVLLWWLSRRGLSVEACAIAGAAWAASPWLILTANNGLETSMALFFVVAAFACLDRVRPAVLGLLLGLAVFSRVDLALLAAVLGLVMLLRRQLRQLAIAAGVAVAVNLPSWVYLGHYTGRLFPISGTAVRHYALWFARGWVSFFGQVASLASFELVTRGAQVLIAVAVAVGALLVLRRREGLRELSTATLDLRPAWAFAGVLLLAYVFWIPGFWYFHRYLVPCLVPLFPLLGSASELALAKVRRRGVVAAVAVLLLAVGATRSPSGNLFVDEGAGRGYLAVARWANQYFPKGTVVGSAQSGALGYAARDLTIVNLDGVVDFLALHSLTRKTMGEYLQRRHVQYVIGFGINIDYVQDASPDLPGSAWQHEGHAQGVVSWNSAWEVYRLKY